MTAIPDFTEAERKRASAILLERYGKLVPVQLADSELQLGVDLAGLSLCPAIYWNERQLANVSSGATAVTLKDDDYHSPLVV